MEENNQTAATARSAAAVVIMTVEPLMPTLSPRDKTLASVTTATMRANVASVVLKPNTAPEKEAQEAEENNNAEEENSGAENNNHMKRGVGDDSNNDSNNSARDQTEVEEDEHTDSDSADTEKEEEEEEEEGEDEAQGHAVAAAVSEELTRAHETPIPPAKAVEEKESPVESSPQASETQPSEEEEEAHADESEEKQAVEENDSSASCASDGSKEPAQASDSESESSREHTEAEEQEEDQEEDQEKQEEEAEEEATNDSENAVAVVLSSGRILDPSVYPPTRVEEQMTEEDEYGGLELRIDIPIDEDSSLHHHHHHHHHHHNGTAIDLDLDLDSDGDSDSDSDDDNDEHEPLDKSTTSNSHHSHSHSNTSNGSLPSVPLTITYPVNEMEVVTNRGGRSGSLSKFLDDADLYRRRSLTSYNDDPLSGLHEKKLTLSAFLDMAIDPILEVLDDADSDVRLWLLQSETVEDVLKEFVKPPVFTGEPHDEYGYYKNYFICSEIIMKLYTGEDDLYESFSSDSSSGSASATTVFGCQEAVDLQKWELLYSIFRNEAPLDEMQLLFFSKALVRLHDGFCLEDGYVANVLRRFLPCVMPHLYSNTIKYMLTLILQSYESVHPITGRNDAMEIVVPLLAQATRLDAQDALNPAAVENASHLLVDMLKANQADRLGAFCRREGGVYLSKYFVRDQFGTIRGFESMTHGYHNFLQFMFLEELGKWPAIVEQIFDNALFELSEIQSKTIHQVSGCLNVQVATELLLLFKKHGEASSTTQDESSLSSPLASASAADISPVHGNPYSDSYPGSPRQSGLDTSMYNLRSLSRSDALWSTILRVATSTAERFCGFLTAPLPSSVEIALAKHLHALVHVHSAELDLELHKGGLMQKYLASLELRPTFDMLLIHIVPAIAFIIKDAECTRARDNWLTLDLFDEVDGASSLPQLLVRADGDIPQLKIYAGLLKDVVDEVLTTKSPTQNNITLQRMCKRCPPWGSPRYSRRSSSSPKLSCKSSTSAASSSASSSAASSPQQPVASSPASPEAVSAASPVEVQSSNGSTPPPREEEEEDQAAAVGTSSAASPSSVEQQPEQHAESPQRTSAIRRLSSRKLSRSSSQRNSEKLTSDQLPATPTTTTAATATATATAAAATSAAAASSSPVDGEPSEPEPSGKKSTHYIKQMLQTPVFRGTMRLGSVIKPPEKSPRNSDLDSSASGAAGGAGNQPSQRGSFGWNSVLKRLRKSFVNTGHGGDKGEKKLLAIANEPYVPPSGGQAAQAEVLVVDMAKGEDVSQLVHRDGGVHVLDVVASSKSSQTQTPTQTQTQTQSDKPVNTITSGYLYKSKFPETGQRNLWERYYFVLNRQDGLLSYYVSESHAKDRTYLRGTARPVSVTEGIPVSANGQHSVYGFQINTQGHGAFMVVVDSIDTRLVWLSEIVACVAMLTPQVPQKRLSLVGDESAAAQAKLLANGGKSWSKQQLRELVVAYYKNLFGPSLRFSTPMDAPASFWMEEKIDPVAESCVLSSNLPDCVPYWGEFHGYSRLCDFWKIRDETLERSSGRVLRIVVDEDEETAVVMTSTTYRILRNSQTVTEESCDIVNMSGGAIISIHCTFDSFRIADAFRKEGISAS